MPCHALLLTLDALFEAAFLIDTNGNIVHTNNEAKELFGWGEERAAAATTVTSAFAFAFPDGAAQDARPSEAATVNGNPSGGGWWNDVVKSLPPKGAKHSGVGFRSGGVTFPVSVSLLKLSDSAFAQKGRQEQQQHNSASSDENYVCAFVRDNTNTCPKRISSEMQLKKERLATGIIEASFDPMFAIDEHGIINMVNGAATRDFGWTREEFMGSNISMITGGGHSSRHDEYIKRYIRTGEKRVMGKKRELLGRKKNGLEFPIELGLTEVSRTTDDEARQFCGFVRDLTDQKHDKVELRRKHSLTLSIIEASFDAMFYINERGIIQMVNEAAVRQFGWRRNEFLGQNISMICGGGRAPNHDNYIKRYLRTGERRVMGRKRELRARRKDGSEFPIELGLTEVQVKSGEERSFCGFIRDLTRQKADETELRRKQRLTAGIIDASFDAVFTINEHGIIKMANRAATQQFGWSKDQLMGKNISLICGGGHAERHDAYLRHYLKTNEKKVMGKRRVLLARRKNGTEFQMELGLSEVKTDDTEERLFTGFVRDLTREKENEKQLKKKQRLTAGIIEASFDACFAIDEHGVINMVNEAAVKQFGYSRDQFIGRNISMVCGGDHAERHDSYLDRYLKTGVKHVMGKRRELPARRKDGSEFPIELGLAEIKTDDGEERQFCGFVRDITLQKEQEEEVKRKQSLTTGLIEASLDSMFAFNERGIIVMVNSSAVTQFGWSREELIGENISLIMGSDHADKHGSHIAPYLETGGNKFLGTQREVRAKRRDGTFFPITLGVSEVEHNGDSRLFAAFIHDLTNQKRVAEMEKAEMLLLNMLPEDIALRLQADSGHIADHFPSVAILFADIVGFTKMSSKMKPVELVAMLNELFSQFDFLVEKYDLNKVKTIGDCYMVTSHPDVDTELDEIMHICNFALDMIDSIFSYNIDHPGMNLNLRIGINVGPVVAGVVGTSRFLYDLWGDAVNLASRMESTGVPGKIHVTRSVVDLVESDFVFESRGEMDVKGIGPMETFILKERKGVELKVPKKKKATRRRSSLLNSLKNLRSSREVLDSRIVELSNRIEGDSSSDDDI